jgi:hypothetical protein
LAVTQEQDVLVVFADAFSRDGDPDDFSLEAIIAHERDKQDLLAKAMFEADRANRDAARTAILIVELRALLERIL